MNKAIGYNNTLPLIKKVRFPKGKIILYMVDGRIIIIPANKFKEIERLTVSQKRKHKTLAGMGLMFEDLDTIFHVSDFIGKDFTSEISGSANVRSKKYSAKKTSHSKAAEPSAKYRKR